jgi:hypothetical protein
LIFLFHLTKTNVAGEKSTSVGRKCKRLTTTGLNMAEELLVVLAAENVVLFSFHLTWFLGEN